MNETEIVVEAYVPSDKQILIEIKEGERIVYTSLVKDKLADLFKMKSGQVVTIKEVNNELN